MSKGSGQVMYTNMRVSPCRCQRVRDHGCLLIGFSCALCLLATDTGWYEDCGESG